MSDTLAGNTPADPSKRTWIIASTCTGIVGAAATAVPFVSTFQPSERAKAAGAAVEVDISAIKPGEKLPLSGAASLFGLFGAPRSSWRP